jgi:hypothetical protein
VADRKQQLLEAFDKEEGDDTETVDKNDDIDGEVTLSDDASVVADESGDAETSDEGTKEGSPKTDGKNLEGDDKKTKVTSAASQSIDSKKTDALKGTKKDPAAKTIQQTEKEAADAGDAPNAWKPAIREHWAKLPKEVREEVQRRETEITQFIGRHGAAIQHKAQFDEMVQPFMPFIAAQQSTPMKAFHGLMTTAARLTTSHPQGKAQVIAEIMRNYGVTPQILDEVLTAQMQSGGAPQTPVNNDPPAWARPLFNFMQETAQAKKERERRTEQEAAAELAEFEKKPFFNDLQSDIGLLMDRAAQKGQLMTLEQAYVKARKMNPEIDAILTQREKAAASNGTGTALDKARKAASTIKGAPGAGSTLRTNGKTVPTNGSKPPDRKSILSAAFDEASEE